jgi:flagellar biogenesis protein FliO
MDLARQMAAVAVVLALFGAALWALRRGTGRLGNRNRKTARDQGRSLQVMGRVTLTPQHSLHIVRAGAREWVVATHPQGCTLISGDSAEDPA